MLRQSQQPLLSLVLAALLAGAAASLAAQQPAGGAPAPSRPKVGIAFSGGGAKGCAHIGVLRVLDEMRIPVDYAAGTSMGSIVGGLYAAGLDPDQLERAILDVDWSDALTDKPSRDQLVMRRKDDDLHYFPDIEVGVGKGGLKMPTGLRAGQKLGFLLRQLTLPVRTVTDFDRLPTPFRAVATNIGDGQMVVLDHGDLARALRASMAIPGGFSAVEIDGQLLVDGGVSNNVPVDVVRAMGADFVIAIDIGSPLTSADQVGRSYVKILGQTMGLITRANMAPRLAQADLVITPKVDSYGMMEFAKGKEIIARGEAEARALADALRPFSLSEEEYAAWKRSRQRPPDPIPNVVAVRVEGNRRVDSRIIDHQIRIHTGSPFAPEAARDDLSRIYGLGDFETVDLELVDEPDGVHLVYRVREKSWGPNYLRAGLAISADFQGTNDLSVLAAINKTRINAKGGEWKTELEVGRERRIETGFYQPLSFRGTWFVEPKIRYKTDLLPFFLDRERIAEVDVQRTGGKIDLGYAYGRFGEVRLGIEREWASAHRVSGVLPPEVEAIEGDTLDRGGVAFSAVVDTLDSATLPKKGGRAALFAFRGLDELGSDDVYTRLELRSSLFHTWGRSTFFANLNGGVSPGSDLPIYDKFTLGGFWSLSGYEFGELRGDNYALVRLGYLFRLGKFLHVGGYGEAGNTTAQAADLNKDPIYTATAILVADTPAGPIYFGYGAADPGGGKAYLLFGRQF